MEIEFLGTDPIKDAAIIKIPYRWVHDLGRLDAALSGLSKEQIDSVLYEAKLDNVFRFIETLADEIKDKTRGQIVEIKITRSFPVGKRE